MTRKNDTEVVQAIDKAKQSAGEDTIILIAENIADPGGPLVMIEHGDTKETEWTIREIEDVVETLKAGRYEVCTIESVWDTRKQKYHSITTWHRRPAPKILDKKPLDEAA